MAEATITVALDLHDNLTPALQGIASMVNAVAGQFGSLHRAVEHGFDPTPVMRMRGEVEDTIEEIEQYRTALRRVSMENALQRVMTAFPSGVEAPKVSGSDFLPPVLSNKQASQFIETGKQLPMEISGTYPVEFLSNGPDAMLEGSIGQIEIIEEKMYDIAAIQRNINQNLSETQLDVIDGEFTEIKDTVEETGIDIKRNTEAQEAQNKEIGKGKAEAGKLEKLIQSYAFKLFSINTAQSIFHMADAVTQTKARIDLMNQSFGETGNLQQKIYHAALNSAAAYQATANAVIGFGTQAKGAFANTDEVVAFTEQLNKIFAISGTSSGGMDSVMQTMTQAMASGALQGENLNTILADAQPIVQNIADYMGVPLGKISELASQGAITAEIIKNSMFAAADQTNVKFDSMSLTFGQMATNMKTQLMMAFQPALQQITALAQEDGFGILVSNVLSGIQVIASGIVWALSQIGQLAAFAQENWSWLGPIIAGVTAAMIAYTTILGITALASNIYTMAEKLGNIERLKAIVAQNGLNASLLACPITWIVLAIAAVIAAIVAWIHHVGGLKAAWLIVVNTILTLAGGLILGLSAAWIQIQNGIDGMIYGFLAFQAGALNALGNLKVMGLTILENFINGAIDLINRLIEMANSITGTSFALIGHVEFAASAAIEEEERQKQRANELKTKKAENDRAALARQQNYEKMKAQTAVDQMRRRAEIIAVQAESNAKKNAKEQAENNWMKTEKQDIAYTPYNSSMGGGIGDPAGATAANTGDTAANTAAMADTMDIMDEELKYMRDAAEQDIINRFTLAELKVDVSNNNTLRTETDFDSMTKQMAALTGEILSVAAEGGHL